jgi:integrase
VAVIPLLSETQTLLEEIGRGEPDQHVLLNSRRSPWTGDGLTHLVVDATTVAGVEKTLHDARGTFATRLRLAGLDRDQIADIMGWKKDRVHRILTRYVDQATVITAMVEKLRANEKRTKTPKRRPNTSVSGRKWRVK